MTGSTTARRRGSQAAVSVQFPTALAEAIGLMAFLSALILATSGVCAVDELPSESDSPKWKVLFDGTSFDGWKKTPGTWTVRDSAAVTNAGELTRKESLPREFELEFECWCDEGVQLMFMVELKNGVLHTLFDIESADAGGDGCMSPREWHKVRLWCRKPNDRTVARSIDGRDISSVRAYSSYSMQFYVEGGDSKFAKLRNIRVKDLAKADRGKERVE